MSSPNQMKVAADPGSASDAAVDPESAEPEAPAWPAKPAEPPRNLEYKQEVDKNNISFD